MYKWRKMTQDEKQAVLLARKLNKNPWHSPPHRDTDSKLFYILSAACYEHKHIIGQSEERMLHIQKELKQICDGMGVALDVWCILSNHYHILVETENISGLRRHLGRMHGRTARQWNIDDRCVGRKVWFNCAERTIRNERHFWASVNYIHHNPVKHGYVEKWPDWQYSSAKDYLNAIGIEKALEVWKEYPILDYGEGWDM